jgi:hypothetical protein
MRISHLRISSIYSKQTAQKDQVENNNNTFTVCPNQISSTASPTATPTATASSSLGILGSATASATSSQQSSTSNGAAAIGGGVAGGIIFLALVLLVCWFLYRRRRVAPLSPVPDYTPVPFAAPMEQSLTDAPHDPFYLATSSPGTWPKGVISQLL